jgi:hypothetical protein
MVDIITSKIIPWKQIKSREGVNWKKLWVDIKDEPVQFFFELFALAMMVIGGFVTAQWAFEIGRFIGRIDGQF